MKALKKINEFTGTNPVETTCICLLLLTCSVTITNKSQGWLQWFSVVTSSLSISGVIQVVSKEQRLKNQLLILTKHLNLLPTELPPKENAETVFQSSADDAQFESLKAFKEAQKNSKKSNE